MNKFSIYGQVSSYTSVEDALVIPDGRTWRVRRVGMSGAFDKNVKAEIYFGTTMLWAEHMSNNVDWDERLTGDGTTELKIKRVNGSNSTETIGGYIDYEG